MEHLPSVLVIGLFTTAKTEGSSDNLWTSFGKTSQMELLVVTYKTLVVTHHSYSCVISTTHTEWRQTFKCQTSLIVFTLLYLLLASYQQLKCLQQPKFMFSQ